MDLWHPDNLTLDESSADEASIRPACGFIDAKAAEDWSTWKHRRLAVRSEYDSATGNMVKMMMMTTYMVKQLKQKWWRWLCSKVPLKARKKH